MEFTLLRSPEEDMMKGIPSGRVAEINYDNYDDEDGIEARYNDVLHG
jgi:hypothetical protein